jgi:FkbM family methyltransferase
VKTLVRKFLNRAGFDVVKLRNSNHVLSTNLMNVIGLYGIRCVLDVGANTGQYGQFLRQIGFRGQIISFEPVKHVFDQLKSAARGDPDWRCFHCALGDADEKRDINVYKSTVFSSFLKANEYSKEHWASLNESTVERVEIRRLDTFFPEIAGSIGDSPCLLKMDTQGFDLNVFRGAGRVLDRVVALQSEVGMIKIYENMADSYDALRVFRDHGFDVSGMFPINRDESLAVIEFDCLMVKRSAAPPPQ